MVTQVPAPGSSVGVGSNAVTITATDVAGQTAVCRTAVLVEAVSRRFVLA